MTPSAIGGSPAMETTSCVKAVVLSASHYRNNSSDTNLVHLQRDLDVSHASFFAPFLGIKLLYIVDGHRNTGGSAYLSYEIHCSPFQE